MRVESNNKIKQQRVDIPRLDLSPTKRGEAGLGRHSSKSRSPRVPLGQVSERPSLMARTISDLQHQEALRKNQSDSLLKSFEARSSLNQSPSPSRQQQAHSPPQRLLKGFSSYVHLQDASKLRRGASRPVLTYQEQLRALQEQTVPPPQPTLAEFKKVYGSSRVKLAGAKTSMRRPGQVKTYAERLKELKPEYSQARVVSRYVSQFYFVLLLKCSLYIDCCSLQKIIFFFVLFEIDFAAAETIYDHIWWINFDC